MAFGRDRARHRPAVARSPLPDSIYRKRKLVVATAGRRQVSRTTCIGSLYLDQGCDMNPSPILDRCVLDDLLDGSLDEKLERAHSSVELYGAKTGNCLRVSVALEEAEIPYIVRKLDLRQSEHRTPEHLSRNPLGKVPTLVERFRDGRALILSQSNAILMYAAEGSPPRLFRQIPPNERLLCNVSSISSPTSSRSAMRVSRPRTMETITHSWTDNRSGLWPSPNRSWKIRPSWPVRLLAWPTSQLSR